MKSVARNAVVAFCLAICAAAAFGWGDETHRAVVRGAAVILPDEIRPFFLVNSDFIAQHSTDPDYIPNRTPAQRAEHFLDIDAYGAPLFKDLPHDRAELEKKFGAAVVVERGLLPWTINREFDRLVKAFRERDWAETRLAAAHLSHFVADATMPLHATQNYDGQFTGNNGVHRRIEVEMVARYHNVSMVAPTAVTEIGDPIAWTFQELGRSLSFCPAFLKADTEARRAAPLDSEAYYLKLNDGAGAIVDARTRDAANAIAGFWLAAWQKAGKPALPPQNAIVILAWDPSSSRFSWFIPNYLPEQVGKACHPFDALTIVRVGAERTAPPLSIHFYAATDTQIKASRLLALSVASVPEAPGWWVYELAHLGGIAQSIQTVCRGYNQCPTATPVFLLLCYGWKADDKEIEALPAAVAHLKSVGAKCCVFTIGTFAEIPSVKQFAADCGAAFHDLGESKDVPALIAKELAPLLAPVDAR